MESNIGNILVIHGPPGSGKTTNAERLKRAFGRTRILDDWAPRIRSHAKSGVLPGDLVLTNELPKVIAHHLPNARILSIEEALASLKVRTAVDQVNWRGADDFPVSGSL